jgi:hypothetical protein
MTLFPEVLELMKDHGIGDRLLTGGGIIPGEDMTTLAEMGIGRLFGPGSSTQDIARYIREWMDGEANGGVPATKSALVSRKAPPKPAAKKASAKGPAVPAPKPARSTVKKAKSTARSKASKKPARKAASKRAASSRGAGTRKKAARRSPARKHR